MNIIESYFNEEDVEIILKALQENNINVNKLTSSNEFELDQHYHCYYFLYEVDNLCLEIGIKRYFNSCVQIEICNQFFYYND